MERVLHLMASKGSPLHVPRIKLIDKAHSLFAETKEHTFESKVADEHAKLLRFLRRDGIGLEFSLWLQSEIGMPWKRFLRKRDPQLAYAWIGMAKEAADAASQAKDGELNSQWKLTFAKFRDRLSFRGVS